MATMAGRSRSALIRRISLEIAIRAPVLPAETQAWAWPSRTASTAFHIDGALAPAQGLGRLLVHGDGLVGVTDLADGFRGRVLGQFGTSIFVAVAMQQEPHRRARALAAKATPGTTMEGPWSPPMASTEMTTDWDTWRCRLREAETRRAADDTSA
jgi:hypothetical protein